MVFIPNRVDSNGNPFGIGQVDGTILTTDAIKLIRHDGIVIRFFLIGVNRIIPFNDAGPPVCLPPRSNPSGAGRSGRRDQTHFIPLQFPACLIHQHQ